jgi:TIR domain
VTDIFISYASEDRERAGKLAEAFGAMGWSVWWDRRIIVGQAYDQTIERELEAARSIVVLWSKYSITSEWVRNEAAVGVGRGVLVPASLERVQLPLEFRRKQTADLTNWNGESSHCGFQAVCEGVANILGRPSLKFQPEPAVRHDRRRIVVVIAILAVGLGFGLYRLGPWHAHARSTSTGHALDAEIGDPADLVVGTYLGNISSDSKGSSRSDVLVTVTRLDRTKVRVTSDNARIGTFEVDVNRIGDNLFNVGGDSTFIAYTATNPPQLVLTARGEVSYGGIKRGKEPARRGTH